MGSPEVSLARRASPDLKNRRRPATPDSRRTAWHDRRRTLEGRRPRVSDPRVLALSRYLRSEFPQALSKHPVEGWKWMDDVGERLQRSAHLDRKHELAEDFARTWRPGWRR